LTVRFQAPRTGGSVLADLDGDGDQEALVGEVGGNEYLFLSAHLFYLPLAFIG
jgi:hypothetical protein